MTPSGRPRTRPDDCQGRSKVMREVEGQALIVADAPVGGAPVAVRHWFDIMAAAAKPESDGSLAAATTSARAYAAAPRPTTRGRPTAPRCAPGAPVRQARGPSPARFGPRCRRLPRRRARPGSGRQHVRNSRRGDPFPASRRRTPLPHRHRRGRRRRWPASAATRPIRKSAPRR